MCLFIGEIIFGGEIMCFWDMCVLWVELFCGLNGFDLLKFKNDI